jgi:hypothetical protein
MTHSARNRSVPSDNDLAGNARPDRSRNRSVKGLSRVVRIDFDSVHIDAGELTKAARHPGVDVAGA